MQEINGDMKVAEIIRRWPETVGVFLGRGCFNIPGGLITRIMTVRNAARMHAIDLAPLLEDLNKATVKAAPQEA
jgi:hypothetical protein